MNITWVDGVFLLLFIIHAVINLSPPWQRNLIYTIFFGIFSAIAIYQLVPFQRHVERWVSDPKLSLMSTYLLLIVVGFVLAYLVVRIAGPQPKSAVVIKFGLNLMISFAFSAILAVNIFYIVRLYAPSSSEWFQGAISYSWFQRLFYL